MPIFDPLTNKTLQILRAASAGNYGVLAAIAYNAEHITALIRAAETARSPLILLLFPSTLTQLPWLVHGAWAACRAASVPVSLHLDHAQDETQIRGLLAANVPFFDSIMVDMSHYAHAENLEKTRALTALCHAHGIAVEAESGRINGGEDGIGDTGALEALMTRPEEVEEFVAAGVDVLAPSVGNVHGDYGPHGPAPLLDLVRLRAITAQVGGRVQVALHGTNDFTPELLRRCVAAGATKLNVNKLLLESWTLFVRANVDLPITQLIDKGMEVLRDETIRWMEACGSAGKA